MRTFNYVAVLITTLVFGLSDVSAAGVKVYNPVKICDCAPCVCEDCQCSATNDAPKVEKSPKTEKNVAKAKYLTYDEAIKLAKSDEEVVLMTYVGEYPKPYPYAGPEVKALVQCYAKTLDGYKTGDIVVSKFYHGNHERISLNGVEDKVVHSTGVSVSTPTQTVTWTKQCSGGVCRMVPTYTNTAAPAVQYAPLQQYYVPGVSSSPCANGNCNR